MMRSFLDQITAQLNGVLAKLDEAATSLAAASKHGTLVRTKMTSIGYSGVAKGMAEVLTKLAATQAEILRLAQSIRATIAAVQTIGDQANPAAVITSLTDVRTTIAAARSRVVPTASWMEQANEQVAAVLRGGQPGKLSSMIHRAQRTVTETGGHLDTAIDRIDHTIVQIGQAGNISYAASTSPSSGAASGSRLDDPTAKSRPSRPPQPTGSDFQPRPSQRDRHGSLTDGIYRVSSQANQRHTTAGAPAGKSTYHDTVDPDEITLHAAQYADQKELWAGQLAGQPSSYSNKAKVPFDCDIGLHSGTGQQTNVVNVYRKKNGTVHSSPGSRLDQS